MSYGLLFILFFSYWPNTMRIELAGIMSIFGKYVSGTLFLCLATAVNISALPVFPGAEGFGTTTPAGRGGSIGIH